MVTHNLSNNINQDTPIGIVGLGKQGRTIANALIEMKYPLIAACDQDPKKINEFKTQHPNIKLVQNINDFPKITIGIDCTLADDRLSIIRSLHQKGATKILCEKPLANTIAKLEEIMLFKTSNKLNIAVNHIKFWSPDFKKAKEILLSGLLGNIEKCNVTFKSSGFGNIGCHQIALTCYLLNTIPKRVISSHFHEKQASFSRKKGHLDPNAKVTYELENSTIATFDCTSNEFQRTSRFEFIGTNGKLELLDEQNTYIVTHSGTQNEYSFKYPWNSSKSSKETLSVFLAGALDDLVNNNTDGNFLIAYKTVEAIIAAQISSLSKDEITFPLNSNCITPYVFS